MQSNAWAQIRAFSAVVALAAFAVAPAGAANDTVQDELKQMRELVLQLQDQVQSQQVELEDQGTVIRDAGLEDRSSSSRLSSLLESTDFSGSIAASYFYNTNSPSGGSDGNGPVANPFHPDSNRVQVDQVWLSMSNAATADSPVGFGVDMVMGRTGSIGSAFQRGVSDNGFWLNQAYLEYMVGGGVTLTAGKFGTHIGYEVANAADNVNITRGFTYSLLQPLSQVGAKLSGSWVGIDVMFGVVNGFGEDIGGFGPTANRNGNDKDIIWSVGWSNDMVALSFNGEWGDLGNSANGDQTTLDFIVAVTPTDAIDTWLDITWQDTNDNEGLGLSLGARFGINDKMGIGGRFEWGSFDAGRVAGTDSDLIGITTTFDYMLADGLTVKAELAYIKADADGASGNSDIFPDEGNGLADDQLLIGVQLVYAF